MSTIRMLINARHNPGRLLMLRSSQFASRKLPNPVETARRRCNNDSGLSPKILDQHFSVAALCSFLRRVVQFDFSDVKPGEQRADFRHIV